MRVQRVLMPGSRVESWTVLGDDHVPVDPVERFLAYLASIERSPNTVKAYAHDQKDWFTFLSVRDLDWQSATLEDVATYVAWLRRPPEARDGRVQVLPTVAHHCAESSVSRKLAALASFCEFHARHGVSLTGWPRPIVGVPRRPRSNRSRSTSRGTPGSVNGRSSCRPRSLDRGSSPRSRHRPA
jgi:integrase/recombinase XerD